MAAYKPMRTCFAMSSFVLVSSFKLRPGQWEAPTSRLHLVLCLMSILLGGVCSVCYGFWFLGMHPTASGSLMWNGLQDGIGGQKRYLYWGPEIDCPGKHCIQCGGLGHQESSLRCALEEALYLNRRRTTPHSFSTKTFVFPSSMCIADQHNDTRLPQNSEKPGGSELHHSSTATLYDVKLLSHTVPVILSDSKEWQATLQQKNVQSMEVEGIKRQELKQNKVYRKANVLKRTANKLAWFMECKNRHNRSATLLPYSFLPSMAAPSLRAAAEHIIMQLGDYDALHVRRGDKVKVYKDRSGNLRTMYAKLDRDTQPEAILKRVKPWIPEGRTLYIATNEEQIHYFDKLSSKYRIMKAENFTAILNPVVHNNYQLFIIERLVLLGAKTLVKTWKEDAGDLSLSDEAKKKVQRWSHIIGNPN